jgi:hypothetical protein
MASPETRKEGDFKLGYEWDRAALNVGGGLSVENDYESRFANMLGRMDFNQKLTSVALGMSYTNSSITSTLDHEAIPYIYETSAGFGAYNDTHLYSQLKNVGNSKMLSGDRRDWNINLSLSQVLSKSAVASLNFGYIHTKGYLSNPYKAVTTVFVDPSQLTGKASVITGTSMSLLENRPSERNQWNGNFSYVQHVPLLDAALHFDYRFYNDDWGISSHTFQLDWAQPLPWNITVTPMVRYYSQTAADFYTPYMVSLQKAPGTRTITFDRKTFTVKVSAPSVLDYSKLPNHYSSDQRLSAFGTLSGGLSISKKFAKGVTFSLAAEYYTHAGSLTLSGQGEGSYANFNYYMFNGSVQVDMSALALPGGGGGAGHEGHEHHHHHGVRAPAGVMFDHMLGEDDWMLGYRYMWSSESGQLHYDMHPVADQTIVAHGCRSAACYIRPNEMSMHMHMLDVMYAPTNWLTLMVMPTYMDMNMDMQSLTGAPKLDVSDTLTFAAVQHAQHIHQTGGIGDTGLYALFKLFEQDDHHVHATLGVTAPTGDVGIKLRKTHGVDIGYIHYGMQLGSGTWDFRPSLTYTGQTGDWSWGAQLSGVLRMESQNNSGFALGNVFQSTAWGSYSFFDWLSASLRALYTTEGSLSGSYNGTYVPIGTMDYGSNYGGRYWDIGFGFSTTVPTGSLKGNRLAVEWLQPVWEDRNGYQMQRDGSLSATWSYSF